MVWVRWFGLFRLIFGLGSLVGLFRLIFGLGSLVGLFRLIFGLGSFGWFVRLIFGLGSLVGLPVVLYLSFSDLSGCFRCRVYGNLRGVGGEGYT